MRHKETGFQRNSHKQGLSFHSSIYSICNKEKQFECVRIAIDTNMAFNKIQAMYRCSTTDQLQGFFCCMVWPIKKSSRSQHGRDKWWLPGIPVNLNGFLVYCIPTSEHVWLLRTYGVLLHSYLWPQQRGKWTIAFFPLKTISPHEFWDMLKKETGSQGCPENNTSWWCGHCLHIETSRNNNLL